MIENPPARSEGTENVGDSPCWRETPLKSVCRVSGSADRDPLTRSAATPRSNMRKKEQR